MTAKNLRDIRMDNWDAARLMGKAHGIVAKAKQFGVLPLLDGSVDCVDCGSAARDYDHRNYFKPLDVAAVCRGCNFRRGRGYPFSVEKSRGVRRNADFESTRQWIFVPDQQKLITIFSRKKVRQVISADMIGVKQFEARQR